MTDVHKMSTDSLCLCFSASDSLMNIRVTDTNLLKFLKTGMNIMPLDDIPSWSLLGPVNSTNVVVMLEIFGLIVIAYESL